MLYALLASAVVVVAGSSFSKPLLIMAVAAVEISSAVIGGTQGLLSVKPYSLKAHIQSQMLRHGTHNKVAYSVQG